MTRCNPSLFSSLFFYCCFYERPGSIKKIHSEWVQVIVPLSLYPFPFISPFITLHLTLPFLTVSFFTKIIHIFLSLNYLSLYNFFHPSDNSCISLLSIFLRFLVLFYPFFPVFPSFLYSITHSLILHLILIYFIFPQFSSRSKTHTLQFRLHPHSTTLPPPLPYPLPSLPRLTPNLLHTLTKTRGNILIKNKLLNRLPYNHIMCSVC